MFKVWRILLYKNVRTSLQAVNLSISKSMWILNRVKKAIVGGFQSFAQYLEMGCLGGWPYTSYEKPYKALSL